jgi:hypothetical protein
MLVENCYYDFCKSGCHVISNRCFLDVQEYISRGYIGYEIYGHVVLKLHTSNCRALTLKETKLIDI